MANRKSVADINYNNEIKEKNADDINRLINDNLGLVKSVVNKFKPKTRQQYEEMLQCGRIGLWKAIKHHNPEKGKLTTIAYRPIVWEMLAYLREKKREDGHKEKLRDLSPTPVSFEDFNIDEIFNDLDEQERDILEDMINGRNRKKIAAKHGMGITRLSRIIQEILRKIKDG